MDMLMQILHVTSAAVSVLARRSIDVAPRARLAVKKPIEETFRLRMSLSYACRFWIKHMDAFYDTGERRGPVNMALLRIMTARIVPRDANTPLTTGDELADRINARMDHLFTTKSQELTETKFLLDSDCACYTLTLGFENRQRPSDRPVEGSCAYLGFNTTYLDSAQKC